MNGNEIKCFWTVGDFEIVFGASHCQFNFIDSVLYLRDDLNYRNCLNNSALLDS
jgi:hypothetical protein